MSNRHLIEQLIKKQNSQLLSSKIESMEDITSEKLEEMLGIKLIKTKESKKEVVTEPVKDVTDVKDVTKVENTEKVSTEPDLEERQYSDISEIFNPLLIQTITNEEFSDAIKVTKKDEGLLLPIISLLDEFIQSNRKNIVDFVRNQKINRKTDFIWNSYQHASKRNILYEYPSLCEYTLSKKEEVEQVLSDCIFMKCELIPESNLIGTNKGFILQIYL